MSKAEFEDAVLAALENPGKAHLDALLAILKKSGNPVPAELAELLNPLWEAFASKLDPEGAAFCFKVAELPLPESALFRKVLVSSATTLLPPYLGRPPIMKAIGVRDEKLPLREIARRWRKLEELKNGVVIFLPSAKRWGVIGTIDNINGTVIVNAFSGSGVNSATPLDTVLKDAILLSAGPELNKLVATVGAVPNAAGFKTIVNRRAVLPVSDEDMKAMAQAGCCRNMAPAAFEKYWENASGPAAAAPAAGQRRSCNGRSLQEIQLLLEAEQKGNPGKFTDEEAGLFAKFFAGLRAETAKREAKLLALVVSDLAPRTTGEQLKTIITPLRAKASFWPESPAKAGFDALSVWGDIPAKSLDALAEASAIGFEQEYLADCALMLPLKALNSICNHVEYDLLFDTAVKERRCSCDLLLWIWKNRKKHNSTKLLSLVNIENVCKALSVSDLPRIWNAAFRELRTSLVDKIDFQLFLLENCPGVEHFASVLQSAAFLNPGERQSIMVKMSRESAQLRSYLEGGAGQKIINAHADARDAVAAPEQSTEFTSALSRKRMQDELDDIINVQEPENREAIKVARSHGDFRENSEYDAAKERRTFLRRRRDELERDLANIQPMRMADVTVSDTAVIGCVVELEFADTGKETFYLLGARDGNPDRKFLSYRSRLGMAVLNHSEGDTFKASGDRSCKLISVSALPAELVAELDA